VKTPPKTLLFGLIAVAALACLVGALLWPRPCFAEEAAARVRLGMTQEQLLAVNVRTKIFQGASLPMNFGDGSTLIVEFSEAPHRVVAVQAIPPDFRRRLRANGPSFLLELIPAHYDPVRSDPRPLRPHPPEEAPR
jgi:hypothetical protein